MQQKTKTIHYSRNTIPAVKHCNNIIICIFFLSWHRGTLFRVGVKSLQKSRGWERCSPFLRDVDHKSRDKSYMDILSRSIFLYCQSENQFVSGWYIFKHHCFQFISIKKRSMFFFFFLHCSLLIAFQSLVILMKYIEVWPSCFTKCKKNTLMGFECISTTFKLQRALMLPHLTT